MTAPIDVTDKAVAQMRAARALQAAIDAEKARAAAEGRGYLYPSAWEDEERAHRRALAAYAAACDAVQLDTGDADQLGLFAK